MAFGFGAVFECPSNGRPRDHLAADVHLAVVPSKIDYSVTKGGLRLWGVLFVFIVLCSSMYGLVQQAEQQGESAHMCSAAPRLQKRRTPRSRLSAGIRSPTTTTAGMHCTSPTIIINR